MVFTVVIHDIRCPECVVSRFDIQVESAPVNPTLTMVVGRGYTDLIPITIGDVCGFGICPALRVKHPPVFFSPVPDKYRVGSSIGNRIPE